MELYNLGWNAITVSFIGTIFFSLLGTWGLVHQNRQIWQNRSGQSVSNIFFICSMFLFLTTLVYGIYIFSLAMIFNGLMRIIPHIPILIGLGKFKGFKKWEKIAFVVLSIFLAAMIISPYKGVFLLP